MRKLVDDSVLGEKATITNQEDWMVFPSNEVVVCEHFQEEALLFIKLWVSDLQPDAIAKSGGRMLCRNLHGALTPR